MEKNKQVPAFLLSEKTTQLLSVKLKRALDNVTDFELIRNTDEELIIAPHALESILALKDELENLDLINVSRDY